MTANSIKLESNVDREQIDIVPHNLLDLIREQIVFIPSSANSLCRAAMYVRKKMVSFYTNTVHILEYTDSNEVTNIALEQSKYVMDNMGVCKVSLPQLLHNHLHITSDCLAILMFVHYKTQIIFCYGKIDSYI